MNAKLFASASAALLLSLSACASNQGGVASGAEVTRFHLDQPIARGQIAVEPIDPEAAGSLEFAQTAAAVERELARQGWTVVRGNARSEQVALISLDQGSRAAMASRPAVSVGVGGGGGGWRGGGVGGGIGVSLPIGGGGAREIVVTELGVRIQRRSDATVFWEGRAQTEARADSPLAQRTAAADRLAAALFEGFPGESGRTIRVE